MKKLVATIVAVVVCGSLFAESNEITWKGDGETPRWSDGSNWVGGVAPEKGDIAVIPEDTTAWASHLAGADGDRDVFNNLSGIRLNGTNAVIIIDVENDGNSGTAVFDFTTPVSGNGHLDIRNTVNDSLCYVTVAADNTGFTGTYDFTNALVKVGNEKAIAPGCRVNFSGCYGKHGLSFCAGLYSNDIYVVKVANMPFVSGSVKDGVPVVTNLGMLVIEKAGRGGYYGGDMYNHSISNVLNEAGDVGPCRLGGTVYVGEGGFYGRARLNRGASVHLFGPNRGTGGYTPFGFSEGMSYVYCRAPNVLCAEFFKYITLDLGGYDQSNVTLTELASAILTTDKPATLTWVGSNTTGNQTVNDVELNGPLSIEYNFPNANGKKMTFGADGKPVSGTMSGAFTVKKSNVYFSLYVSLPKLRKLASTSKSSSFPSRVYVQTANLNPGRLRLEAAGEHGSIDVAEGIQLDVLNFLTGDAYVPEGIYGSAAAHEAHPELVDENHILSCLTGTGTVKVRCDGEPGMMLLLR